MTLAYLRAIAATLQFEGDRFTDDPDDRGGATRYGITQRFLDDLERRQVVATIHESVKDLSLLEALDIYWRGIWTPLRLPQFTRDDIAAKVFDQCVNMGIGGGTKLLQRVLNKTIGAGLTVDGDLGPRTLGAVNGDAARTNLLLPALIDAQAAHYTAIVKRDPTQAKFINGWMRRSQYDPRRLHV